MQKYTMTAKCVLVGPVQEIGKNGFKKREIVLCENENEQYPHFLVWELKKDRVNLVNETYQGREITVSGYPESRAWDDPKTGKKRFFTTMTAVSVAGGSDKAPAGIELSDGCDFSAGEVDDMPF